MNTAFKFCSIQRSLNGTSTVDSTLARMLIACFHGVVCTPSKTIVSSNDRCFRLTLLALHKKKYYAVALQLVVPIPYD